MPSCIANADKVSTCHQSQDARVVLQSFRTHIHSTAMRPALTIIGCVTLLQLAMSQGHGIELPLSASESKVLTQDDQTIQNIITQNDKKSAQMSSPMLSLM